MQDNFDSVMIASGTKAVASGLPSDIDISRIREKLASYRGQRREEAYRAIHYAYLVFYDSVKGHPGTEAGTINFCVKNGFQVFVLIFSSNFYVIDIFPSDPSFPEGYIDSGIMFIYRNKKVIIEHKGNNEIRVFSKYEQIILGIAFECDEKESGIQDQYVSIHVNESKHKINGRNESEYIAGIKGVDRIENIAGDDVIVSYTRSDTLIFGSSSEKDIINLLDIEHRAKLSRMIVERYFTEDDRRAIDELINGRRKWHVFRGLHFDGQRDTAATTTMGVIAAARARPFAFLEGDGAVDRVVKPKKGLENNVRSTFGPHIDHAWRDFSFEQHQSGAVKIPDYVALGGVNNPNRIGTLFCDPRHVYHRLSEITQYQLEKEQWSFPAPSSVTPPKISHKRAIIVRDRNHQPVIRLNPRIVPESQAAADAQAELLDVLRNKDLWTEVVLEPGEMVLASGTALHMRGEVTGDPDPATTIGLRNFDVDCFTERLPGSLGRMTKVFGDNDQRWMVPGALIDDGGNDTIHGDGDDARATDHHGFNACHLSKRWSVPTGFLQVKRALIALTHDTTC